jgi:2'-5' RNA ligase
MALAVEMFFDRAADAAVRELWRALAESALPSLHGTPVRPHVSLTVCDEAEVDGVREALSIQTANAPRLQLSLNHLGRFPSTQVAYLGVAPTMALLKAHDAFDQMLSGLAESVWDHYRPGAWVPHCTLAMPVPDADMARLLKVCRAIDLPIRADVHAIGLVHVPSGDDLGTYEGLGPIVGA